MAVTVIENDKRCPQALTEVVIPANLSHTHTERIDYKPVDVCVTDIVRALVEGGIKTSGSCCGHQEADGVVVLTDGRILSVSYPAGWHERNLCPCYLDNLLIEEN
jgi:hypothetical protein